MSCRKTHFTRNYNQGVSLRPQKFNIRSVAFNAAIAQVLTSCRLINARRTCARSRLHRVWKNRPGRWDTAVGIRVVVTRWISARCSSHTNEPDSYLYSNRTYVRRVHVEQVYLTCGESHSRHSKTSTILSHRSPEGDSSFLSAFHHLHLHHFVSAHSHVSPSLQVGRRRCTYN